MCFIPSNSLCMNEYTDHLILPKHQQKIYRHILGFLFTCVCALSHSVVSNSLQSYGLAHQAPLSMEFSRQEFWNELPFPAPEDLLNPDIKLTSFALAGGFFATAPLQSILFLAKTLQILALFFLQSGQAKDFLNHQILVSFCLTILLLIYLFLLSFYYNQQEETMFYLQRFAVLDS